MNVSLPMAIGLLASCFTALSLLPQLLKLWKEKKAENISIRMLAILFAGLVLWIYYGLLKQDWILIIANSVSLSINSVVVVLTIKYKK